MASICLFTCFQCTASSFIGSLNLLLFMIEHFIHLCIISLLLLLNVLLYEYIYRYRLLLAYHGGLIVRIDVLWGWHLVHLLEAEMALLVVIFIVFIEVWTTFVLIVNGVRNHRVIHYLVEAGLLLGTKDAWGDEVRGVLVELLLLLSQELRVLEGRVNIRRGIRWCF